MFLFSDVHNLENPHEGPQVNNIRSSYSKLILVNYLFHVKFKYYILAQIIGSYPV